MLWILRHRDVQLRLASSWARPAILAVGKGRGGMFVFDFFFFFVHLFLLFHSISFFSTVPLIHLLYYLLYLSSPFLWETTKITHKGWHVVEPQQNCYVFTICISWVCFFCGTSLTSFYLNSQMLESEQKILLIFVQYKQCKSTAAKLQTDSLQTRIDIYNRQNTYFMAWDKLFYWISLSALIS